MPNQAPPAKDGAFLFAENLSPSNLTSFVCRGSWHTLTMKGTACFDLFGGSAKLALVGVAAAALAAPSLGQNLYAKGRVLVQYKGQTAPRTLGATEWNGAQPIGYLGHRSVHVLATPKGVDEKQFARQLAKRPDVAFADVDYVFELQAPNDPMYPNQWHLQKTATSAAWLRTTGTDSIVVAVLDSGVDTTHPDLASKLVPGWNFIAGNSNVLDDNGHGTAVAGSVTAATDNAIGIAGLAWNCRMMPLKVAGSNGSAYSSTLYNALVWAADHGARVANMSYMVSSNSLVKSGMAYFASKGGVCTVSAGNYGTLDANPDSPNCLTVSATDSADKITTWSNYGTIIDLSAPGQNIVTTSRGGTYSTWWGTSFSAPITAAGAALVLSANPDLTSAEAMAVMKDAADDLGEPGWDQYYGAGRLNVDRAVAAALAARSDDGTAPNVGFGSPTDGEPVQQVCPVTVNASDDTGVARVDLLVDGQSLATFTAGPFTANWDTQTVSDGSHQLTAVATDVYGNTSDATVTVQVRNGVDSESPVPVITSPKDGTSLTNRLAIKGVATDNVGVSYVEIYINGRLKAKRTTPTYSVTFLTSSWVAGAYKVEVRAYDAAGNQGISAPVTVTKK